MGLAVLWIGAANLTGAESPAVGGANAEARANADADARRAAPAFEVANKAREELLDLGRRMRELEDGALVRRKAAEARLDALAAERQNAARAVQALKAHAEKREKELAARKELETKETREAARLESERKALLETIRQSLERLRRRIETGIPWKLAERKAAVDKALEALAAADAEPATALAGMRRLQEHEESLGRLVEAGVLEVDVRGERRIVPAIRLGLLGIAFTSADCSFAGFVGRGQKVEEVVARALAAEERYGGAYIEALEILRGRRSPRIVDLYIPALPLNEETR